MARRAPPILAAVVIAAVSLAGCADDTTSEPDFAHCFDSQPRPLSVVIDPSLAPPAEFIYSCTGDAGWGDGACGASPQPSANLDGDLNIFLRSMGLVGWWPVIEANAAADARVCGVHFSDTESPPSCEQPVCATTGTLTLSSFPSTPSSDPIAVVVDADYANGAHLHAEFAVPIVQ